MSEPSPSTPPSPAQPPIDPRRLAGVLVQRVGRAPLVLGGTVVLLALWTGAFLLAGKKPGERAAQPPAPPPNAESSPGTRELVQRFLEESRRQAEQDAAAVRADRFAAQEPGDFYGAPPPPYGPPPAAESTSPAWEMREEPRRLDRRIEREPRDPGAERLQRALEASPLVSAGRQGAETPAEQPASPLEGLLAATERLAQITQQPAPTGPPEGFPEGFPNALPARLQPATPSPALRTASDRQASPFMLAAGTLLPAVLTSAANSDAPGTVSAVVNRDVFDSRTGASLLVPAGSRLLGTSGTAVHGQNRLEITWSRLTLLDGTTYELGAMPAADSSGATGVRDRTNRHLGRTFGSALLLSVFTAAAQLSQPNSFSGALRAPTAQEIAAGALGQQVNATADALIERELRIPPTLVLRPGTTCQVVVTTDLVFPGPFRP